MSEYKHNLHRVLEIAYCIEHQFESDTRLLLIAGGGCWSLGGKESPYLRWIKELFNEAEEFCLKEDLE